MKSSGKHLQEGFQWEFGLFEMEILKDSNEFLLRNKVVELVKDNFTDEELP